MSAAARLARGYHVAWRVLRRVRPSASDWLGAAALGVLPRGGLHAVDEAVYDQWPTYRGDAHNTAGLFPWESTALDEHFQGCRRVMLLAAGGGREALALWQRGMEVDAFECNPGLVEAAGRLLASQGCPVCVRLLPRDSAPREGGPYDGAVLGWSMYTLVAGRERRIALLRAARARMAEGAPLLLSFFTREPPDEPLFQRMASASNLLRRLRGAARVEVGDAMRPNYVHYFTHAELAAEVEAAGFRLLRFHAMGRQRHQSGWAVACAPDAGALHGLPSLP